MNLTDKVFAAVQAGNNTRQALMKIDHLRHMTWGAVSLCLKELCKSRKLIATKTGWKLC